MSQELLGFVKKLHDQSVELLRDVRVSRLAFDQIA